MCLKRPVLFILFCLTLPFAAQAQKYGKTMRVKSTYTKDRYNYRAPRVGHQKAKTICPIFENSKYPYQGMGFKLGDPFALTYKFYPRKHIAFVADVGKPSSALYSRYFREEFERTSSDILPELDGIEYTSHRVTADFIVEAKALYQLDADKLTKGLQVYTGAGWEYRITRLEFDYTFATGPNENDFGRIARQRTTQGLQGIVGIEYAYFQLPVSAFMELDYYVDILADPGWTHFQGGIGLRYVF
jgi:hypothetical protein